MRREIATALLLTAGLFAAPASAAPVGFDFLGIKSPRWDCDAMLQSLSTLPAPVPCGAFLDNTFGKSDACLRRLLASGRCSSFRGHLAWTNHKPSTSAALAPAASSYDALAAANPRVKFYGSAICEHYMTAQQSSALNASLRPLMPHIQAIVDSGSNAADPAAIRECHGPDRVCTAVSLDGQSAFDVDVERFKNNGTEYALLWAHPYNCKHSDKDKRPPATRTDCPTQDQFNLLTRISYPMPPWPPGAARLSPPEIWKPMSENHGGCKGKDCKPVAILNARVKQLIVRGMNGKQIATMPYFGPYGRQSRYYANLTAFQLGQLAEQVSQSEFIYLDDGKRWQVVNAYRRGGVMR